MLNKSNLLYSSLFLFGLALLSGCMGSLSQAGIVNALAAPTRFSAPKQPTPSDEPAIFATETHTPLNTEPAEPAPTAFMPAATSAPSVLMMPFMVSLSPAEPTEAPTPSPVPPETWKDWPVMPGVSERMREVYQRGLEQGRNPNAFSILGDCQSQPELFMGIFDADADIIADLRPELQGAIEQFRGSFYRHSPTIKDGTTAGALLWSAWNDNPEGNCQPGETPLECELRVHNSSIIFIHIGTHWEARNERYLTLIIERILEHGAVPVLVTKADNRELDERVNQMMASLAAQYDLPLWNFWASVQHLPNGGLKPGDPMYLSDEGLAIHQIDGLEALNQVWRGLQ